MVSEKEFMQLKGYVLANMELILKIAEKVGMGHDEIKKIIEDSAVERVLQCAGFNPDKMNYTETLKRAEEATDEKRI